MAGAKVLRQMRDEHKGRKGSRARGLKYYFVWILVSFLLGYLFIHLFSTLECPCLCVYVCQVG